MHRFVALVTSLAVISMTTLFSLEACGQQRKESHAEASQPQSPAQKEQANLIPYRKGEKWGFSDAKKTLVIEPKYDYAFPFSGGLAHVLGQSGKSGFIDNTGREVTPLKYDDAKEFVEGMAWVELNSKWGFIDKSGTEVTKIKYDDLADAFSEGMAYVGLDGKYGFIDKSGKEAIPLMYEKTRSFSDGLARVKLNGKWGFVNKSGKEVTALKYDDAESSNRAIAIDGENESAWSLKADLLQVALRLAGAEGNQTQKANYQDQYYEALGVCRLNSLSTLSGNYPLEFSGQ
jgi:hypothetical protein